MRRDIALIFLDDDHVKIGGTVLPGIYKSIEVKTGAQVEEQEVKGSSAKPKQAIGYEDGKITIELSLEDGETETKEQKLERIQNLFRFKGQGRPEVHKIISAHTAARGITDVIFKELSTKETNKKEELTASIELWEYVPMTITASKGTRAKSQKSSGGPSSLNKDYQSYVTSSRGSAPKTSQSPAKDDRIPKMAATK